VDGFEVEGFDDAAVFGLAFYYHEVVLGYDLAKLFEDIGHDDKVRVAGLVLEVIKTTFFAVMGRCGLWPATGG
jgi:hypothetical protein